IGAEGGGAVRSQHSRDLGDRENVAVLAALGGREVELGERDALLVDRVARLRRAMHVEPKYSPVALEHEAWVLDRRVEHAPVAREAHGAAELHDEGAIPLASPAAAPREEGGGVARVARGGPLALGDRAVDVGPEALLEPP